MLSALLQVAVTNLLLSSDNVLMIALMSKGVRRVRRALALLCSLLASVALQLAILFVVAFLFRFTVLQSVFGVVICLMAFHLIRRHSPHAEAEEPTRRAGHQGLGRTVVRITAGNLMMSFENEAALITLAQGNVWLAWIGMLATAPIIFFGSHLVTWWLGRYPVIVYAGAVYLFSVGSHLLFSAAWLRPYATAGTWALTLLFAAYVLLLFLARLRERSGSAGTA